MANLVCWASGLLEVLADKDTPVDGGPVVLMHGTASKMVALKTSHGEARKRPDGVRTDWFVPGTKPIPQDETEAAKVQHDNMSLVIEFNKKILPPALKKRLIE